MFRRQVGSEPSSASSSPAQPDQEPPPHVEPDPEEDVPSVHEYERIGLLSSNPLPVPPQVEPPPRDTGL